MNINNPGEGMPTSPPIAERLTPPVAGQNEQVIETSANFRERHGRIIGGVILASTIAAGLIAANSCSNDIDKTSESKPTTTLDDKALAEKCEDPSDSEAMIFGTDGKPNLGFEATTKISDNNLANKIREEVCTEKEALKYYSQVHPGFAFDGITGINAEAPSEAFKQIDSDEDTYKQVAKNLSDFLTSTNSQPALLSSKDDASKQLFTLRFDNEKNTVFAEPLTDVSGIVVLAFNQAKGDADLNKAAFRKYIILGLPGKDGTTLASPDTGTIVVTQESLGGTEVRESDAAASDQDTENPAGANETKDDKNGTQGKTGGSSKNNKGPNEGDTDTGGSAGPKGKKPEAGPNGVTPSPANGGGTTPGTNGTIPGTTPGTNGTTPTTEKKPTPTTITVTTAPPTLPPMTITIPPKTTTTTTSPKGSEVTIPGAPN